MQTLAEGSRDLSTKTGPNDDGMGYGWVANTTDDILSLKDQFFDILITIPPSYTKRAKDKVWPRLEIKKGTEIKATQRDLRRYRTLRRELQRSTNSQSPRASKHSNRSDPTSDLPFEYTQETCDDASSTDDTQLAEPQSWSALAYNSFIWWASAGERRTDRDEEEEYDAALLQNFDASRDGSSPSRPRSARKSPARSSGMEAMNTQPAGLEMTIIAYFHRLTGLILKTLADIVDASDYSDVDGESGSESESEAIGTADRMTTKRRSLSSEELDAVFVSGEDMSRMGLDVWSQSDREFVRELVAFYWGRKADVRGGRVECCGMRIC